MSANCVRTSLPDTKDLFVDMDHAQRIICKHHPSQSIVNLIELKSRGFSSKTYLVDLAISIDSAPLSSCFLTISPPTGFTGTYHPNSLTLVAELLATIRASTDIPIPESILDTSLSLIPFHYLLSPPAPITSSNIISLPEARTSGILTQSDIVLLELHLGKFLGQLHSGVQNDWYGLPQLATEQVAEVSYSWQETFTSFLEDLLSRLELSEPEYELPYQDIRLYLSRAIWAFLFDDIEVPSLIWFTGSEDDIYITVPSSASPSPPAIAAIVPNMANALWGDPLLECFMMGSGNCPTAAFLEGYLGGGGSPLLVFPRQKTKRIWYTVFLALLVLTEYGVMKPSEEDEPFVEEKRIWARETLDKCTEALKDAPCY